MSDPKYDDMTPMQRWEAKVGRHEHVTLADVADVLRQMRNYGVDKAVADYCWGRIL